MDKLILIAILITCANTVHAARSITVDPSFAYYKDRSAESVVGEIRANGYDDIRMIGVQNELVKAFKDSGAKVWFLTFMNGTYSTAELPKGWEAWQMKLRKPSKPDGFTYLCCNNPDYRTWKKQQITAALKACAYDGVDLIEPFFPAYPGPSADMYGCLCDHCVAAFKRMYPEAPGPPDFEDAKSAHYWKTDKTLYEKWVGFRVSSVVNYLDEIVNGKDGIREKYPKVTVATWSLGLDVPDQIAKLREWEGLDAAMIVKRVKPDMHVIQTDWPDWSKPDLSSKYPLKYKPVVDSIREVAPALPLMLQADIGSRTNMRRSRTWLEEVEKRAKEIGCESTTSYEYSLGDYIYTEPLAVLKTEAEPGGMKLTFNKRVDTVTASNIGNYSVNSGRVDYVKVDGNIVHLSISGADGKVEVTMSGITDDEPRRLYHDKPACALTDGTRVKAE
jgi:hypothetical protein